MIALGVRLSMGLAANLYKLLLGKKEMQSILGATFFSDSGLFLCLCVDVCVAVQYGYLLPG